MNKNNTNKDNKIDKMTCNYKTKRNKYKRVTKFYFFHHLILLKLIKKRTRINLVKILI